MGSVKNAAGRSVLLEMVRAIQKNKDYLGEVDGLIGDGDHGMNMNKGFTLFEKRLGDREILLTEGLDELGIVLFNEIGGSMGPIYGTIFMDMAEAGEDTQEITAEVFTKMLESGLEGVKDIVEARVGDKTLIDTYEPAVGSLHRSIESGRSFAEALEEMKAAAQAGRDSTKDLAAKFGRSSRLGERSRGVLDAGAVSCSILLCAMADGLLALMGQEGCV